jgi:hypothetical protein
MIPLKCLQAFHREKPMNSRDDRSQKRHTLGFSCVTVRAFSHISAQSELPLAPAYYWLSVLHEAPACAGGGPATERGHDFGRA